MSKVLVLDKNYDEGLIRLPSFYQGGRKAWISLVWAETWGSNSMGFTSQFPMVKLLSLKPQIPSL